MHPVYCKIFLLLFLVSCFSTNVNAQPKDASLSIDSNVLHIADPTVFQHKGLYYLYGTVERASGNGFLVYTSTDLKTWTLSTLNNGYALKKGDAFGSTGFWAPQVFLYRSTFYMAYVANENIAIAESSSPLGPFTQKTIGPLTAPVKQIDPFIFIDADGKKYLYHVRLAKGNRIIVAEMTDDFSAVKEETVKECITASVPWENTANAPWPVAEGPAILKHRGLYYLFYTANDFRNPDYAVGYATSAHPLGPWKKYAKNPIINKALVGINGTGHGDFFNKRKELYYVLHTHNSNTKVGPRNSALIRMKIIKGKKENDYLLAEGETFHFLKSK
jgi:beta-xylosidase